MHSLIRVLEAPLRKHKVSTGEEMEEEEEEGAKQVRKGLKQVANCTISHRYMFSVLYCLSITSQLGRNDKLRRISSVKQHGRIDRQVSEMAVNIQPPKNEVPQGPMVSFK